MTLWWTLENLGNGPSSTWQALGCYVIFSGHPVCPPMALQRLHEWWLLMWILCVTSGVCVTSGILCDLSMWAQCEWAMIDLQMWHLNDILNLPEIMPLSSCQWWAVLFSECGLISTPHILHQEYLVPCMFRYIHIYVAWAKCTAVF